MSGVQDGKIRVVSPDTDVARALRGLSIRNHAREGPTISLPLCKFYARGHCANGRACRFYHPPDPVLEQAVPRQDTLPPSRPSAASFVSRRDTDTSTSEFVDFRDAYASVFVPRDQDELTVQIPAARTENTIRSVSGLAEECGRSYAGAASRGAGVDTASSYQKTDESHVSRQHHWRTTAMKVPKLHTALCRYHADGNCRYGQDCMYIHGSFCSICLKNVLHPKDNTLAAKHVEECTADAERRAQLAENTNVECGICYESPAAHTRKLGLLHNCDHVFCLKCIREWRGTESAESFGREAVRTCPICRIESHMVIPSDTYERDPEVKERLYESYKAKLRLIPCKHYAFGEGTCPFGTSCLYSHVDREGNEPDKDSALLFSDTGSKLRSAYTLSDYL